MTPAEALLEAQFLYESKKPVGWRVFNLDGIKKADRADWYKAQVRKAYPRGYWEDAERSFYADLKLTLAAVNAGNDPNLPGRVNMGFKALLRVAKGVAARVNAEDAADTQRIARLLGYEG